VPSLGVCFFPDIHSSISATLENQTDPLLSLAQSRTGFCYKTASTRPTGPTHNICTITVAFSSCIILSRSSRHPSCEHLRSRISCTPGAKMNIIYQSGIFSLKKTILIMMMPHTLIPPSCLTCLSLSFHLPPIRWLYFLKTHKASLFAVEAAPFRYRSYPLGSRV
jgi:hypothetical protein